MFRRTIAALCVVFAGAALAQGYPDRPLRIVVPFPAGGPTDISARIIGQKLTEAWGQPVVVDNRAGANGIIGQEAVAKAKPDGYTILLQSIAFAVNPSLYKLPYDTDKDFIPVTLVASTPLMLVVNPNVPAKSVADLVALAKAKPGQLNFASFGNGSIAHLAGELLNTTAGVRMTHVAYKGVPQSIADVIAGEVQLMFPTIPSALPHVKSGKLRGLAVTSRERSPLAPELPTMIEAGIPGYESGTWFGLFYPAGTPQAIVAKLHGEAVRILRLPEVKAQFENQGFDPIGSTPEEFRKFIRDEMEKYARVTKAAGVKVE
jgi:tripartite-type tricarboxylate transporter receptor subunit TctC